MAEDESEQVITMQEFIENQDAAEENADLVLGGDEGKECTYQQGYLPRQAIFSCVTCTPLGNAGVCTACCLTCHDGHEIIELWTKRHFKCDCGNSKFGTTECKLWKEKEGENSENSYNQNFLGLYCSCHRRYPNQEDEELGEMLQCCICEDWFHEAHLGLDPAEKVPRDDEGDLLFDELICQSCITRCSFLLRYPGLLMKPVAEALAPVADDEKKKSSASEGEADAPNTKLQSSSAAGSSEAKMPLAEDRKNLETPSSNGDLIGICSAAGSSGTKAQTPGPGDVAGSSGSPLCKLGNGGAVEARGDKAVFMERNWRLEICQCDACKLNYASIGVSFLLDQEDSLRSYEEIAKAKRQSKLEQVEGAGLKFLHNLNHVHKVEFLHGINDMTSELSNFFGSFRDSGKTVTSDDIHEFFENLKQKRRKLS